MRASYRSDLSAITLDENSNQSWIMALKYGRYAHPIFDEIVIDPDRAARFVANEERRVRGISMDVDYDHKAMRMDAAGWVLKAEAREDGIWYLVDWTDEAAKKIRAKEYRYFSAEFADQWTHAESGTTYQDVLFGGGLTNRPFIKGMVPVNLSESEAEQARLAEETTPPTGGEGATEGGAVDLTAIRTALKLSEGTSDEAVIEAVVAKLAEAPAPVAPAEDDVAKLAEGNPVVARLLAEQVESKRRLAEMEASMRLAEVRTSLHEVDADTTTAITPAVKELAQPLLVKLPAKERAELLGIMRQFAEGKGTVKLGESAALGNPVAHSTAASRDAVKEFTDLISKIEKEDSVPFKEALRRAQIQNPMLFSEYHDATTAFKVVGS